MRLWRMANGHQLVVGQGLGVLAVSTGRKDAPSLRCTQIVAGRALVRSGRIAVAAGRLAKLFEYSCHDVVGVATVTDVDDAGGAVLFADKFDGTALEILKGGRCRNVAASRNWSRAGVAI